jgi:hypothetical protein
MLLLLIVHDPCDKLHHSVAKRAPRINPNYLFYGDFNLYHNIRQNDEIPHLYDHTQVPTLAYPYGRFQSSEVIDQLEA